MQGDWLVVAYTGFAELVHWVAVAVLGESLVEVWVRMLVDTVVVVRMDTDQETSLVAVKVVEDAEVAVGMEVEPEAALATLKVVGAGEGAQLVA